MNDRFPFRMFFIRTFDILVYLAVFLFVVVFVISARLTIAQIGVIILVLGLYQEYRQREFYDDDIHERSILARELLCFPVNEVAQVRSRLAKINVLLIVFGTILSGWAAFDT